MKTLKMILAAALLALAGTGCGARNGAGPVAAINDAPTRRVTTVTDRQGNTTETTLDNSGRAAAADGQAVTTTDEVWKVLGAKLPTNNWTMTENVYSSFDIPNEVKIDKLKEEHKNILKEMAAAAEAGATKDYDELGKRAASIAAEIASRLKGALSGPEQAKGDKRSVINRTLSVGSDHWRVPEQQAKEFGQSVRTAALNQNTISNTVDVQRTDTSTTEQIRIVAEEFTDLAEKRLAYSLAEALIDEREENAPDEIATPAPVPSAIPGKVEPASISTDGDQNFLWKPKSDSDGNLVVLFPAAFNGRLSNVTVNGEKGRFNSVANGNRTHYRFSKPGSAYTAPAKVSALIDGKTPWSTSVPAPGLRTTIPGLKPPAKTIPASDLIQPADPPVVPPNVIGPGTTTPPAGGDAAAPGESLAP